MRRVVIASLVVAALAAPTVLADKNVNDIKKVESELDDAQQRLENVKQRMMGEEGASQSAGLADKIASVLEAAKARVGGSSDESAADLANRKLAEGKDALGDIGSESMSEKAARKVREALGRDTLADKAQHLYNDAVEGLSASDIAGAAKDGLNSIGQETYAEKAARKIREATGRETNADIAQRKYLEAKDALGQVRNINFAEMPEKAQKLKDRLQSLGEQALASASGQVDAIQDAIEPSTWEKIKTKVGLTHEPTASEKAALVADHLKAQAADKANDLKNAAYEKYGKVRVASAFNDFLGKMGASPSNAVNMAKEWIGLDSEAREKRRHEKQITKEAHEALDDLLEKLLDEVDNDPSKVESIQVSVKAEQKHTSFVQRIKDRFTGGNKDDTAAIDAAGGYEGMKDKISELIDSAKAKLGPKATEEEVESYVAKAARKLREAKDRIPSSGDLKDAANAVGSETLAERAQRKVREALGRDTTADKIHHKLADAKDTVNSVDTASISEKLHGYVDSAKDKLHRTSAEDASNIASQKYQDAKDTISALGQESLTERAARKVREALGRDTAADKAHHQIDEAREMYMNAMANMPDSADLKDKIASFGQESYAEKAARKVREALGQDTASDKAHRKLADAKSMLETFNAAAVKDKLNDIKDSVVDAASNADAASIKDRVTDAYANAKDKINAHAADLKDSASAIGSETLTDKAGRKVREALGRDTTADKIHHKVADAKDAYNTHSSTISDKIQDVKDSILSLGTESLTEKAARKVREALGRETTADKAQAQVEQAREMLSSLNAEALKNKAANLKDAAVESATNAKDAVLNKLNTADEVPQKGKLTQVKEALFGNAKDNKIEAAEKQLQEALKKLEQARAL